jgi:hypothetical protein
MYRTHHFLLKYYLPLLLLVGKGLALWPVQVSWYVPVVLLPVGALVIMLVVGSMALARESRTAPAAPERIPKERSSVLTGDPLVVVARTKEIEEEPTNAPLLVSSAPLGWLPWKPDA